MKLSCTILMIWAALAAPLLRAADDTAFPVGLAGTPAEAPADGSSLLAAAEPILVRITSSFDAKHAPAVLRQVAKLMHAGFVRRDAESVAKDINLLPADQTRRWEFLTIYKSQSYPLRIRARLDDFGMLDLDFFCAPSVAAAVRGAVDGYLNSRGL
jgi:hypothetical protein